MSLEQSEAPGREAYLLANGWRQVGATWIHPGTLGGMAIDDAELRQLRSDALRFSYFFTNLDKLGMKSMVGYLLITTALVHAKEFVTFILTADETREAVKQAEQNEAARPALNWLRKWAGVQ